MVYSNAEALLIITSNVSNESVLVNPHAFSNRTRFPLYHVVATNTRAAAAAGMPYTVATRGPVPNPTGRTINVGSTPWRGSFAGVAQAAGSPANLPRKSHVRALTAVAVDERRVSV